MPPSAAVAAAAALAAPRGDAPPPALSAALQRVIDAEAETCGCAVQLGWKSADAHFALAAGRTGSGARRRRVTPADTFLWGSGTKPYTAAAVFRLVDAGAVALRDPVARHVDPALAALGWAPGGAGIAHYFGADWARRATVHDALLMRTGLQDWEGHGDGYDDALLFNRSAARHAPAEFLARAAQFPRKCAPGACFHYASVNYVVLGVLLLAHQPAWRGWADLDVAARLGLPPAAYDFLQDGALAPRLSVEGNYTPADDRLPRHPVGGNTSATILGWAAANLCATAAASAAANWALCGAAPTMVSAASLAAMEDFQAPVFLGGNPLYGAGLELSSADVTQRPTRGALGSYVGHGGWVFGFVSSAGYLFGLNASVALVVGSDDDAANTRALMCRVINAAAPHRGANGTHLSCPD